MKRRQESFFDDDEIVADRTEEKKVAAVTRPKSILEACEYIVELAQDSNLSEDFFRKAALQLRYISRKLKISAMQAALLAIFVDRSDDCRIRISEIARYCGCRTTRILRLQNEVDVLAQLHYLRVSRSRDNVSYRVPSEVIDALRANQPYVKETPAVPDTIGFFESFRELMEDKENDEVSYDEVKDTIASWLEEIRESVFARVMRGYDFGEEDRTLLIFMLHLFVENNDDNQLFNDFEKLYDDRLPRWVKSEFMGRKSELFQAGLVENVNEDGIGRSDAFRLTDKAKAEFLPELNISTCKTNDKDLIKSDTLVAKDLIYNPSELYQIEELYSILSADRFAEVQTRLRDAGMRQGFCCLFYGSPGTGKTETVYQIARRTGRAIMQVDVDKIKSCWVGESEKNIKKIFDRYRRICKDADLAPILLFNEADAVLGVRMEGAAQAVDKMENSLQNIILQEMESLEGIMIATTNLTSNLDKAFERRFLYKIRFNKPTVEARAKIWQGMLKGISEIDAELLAEQFDLSGGEIENIARKHSVGAILSGRENIDINSLIDICRHERISTSRPTIGF